jgi:hypothetical protein
MRNDIGARNVVSADYHGLVFVLRYKVPGSWRCEPTAELFSLYPPATMVGFLLLGSSVSEGRSLHTLEAINYIISRYVLLLNIHLDVEKRDYNKAYSNPKPGDRRAPSPTSNIKTLRLPLEKSSWFGAKCLGYPIEYRSPMVKSSVWYCSSQKECVGRLAPTVYCSSLESSVVTGSEY